MLESCLVARPKMVPQINFRLLILRVLLIIVAQIPPVITSAVTPPPVKVVVHFVTCVVLAKEDSAAPVQSSSRDTDVSFGYLRDRANRCRMDSLENNDAFQLKPFYRHDMPINQDPPEWASYRLSMSCMKSIQDVSTHRRATCNFPTNGVVTAAEHCY